MTPGSGPRLPTIKYLRDKGARAGAAVAPRPAQEGPDPKYSMQPVVRALEKLLGAPVTFLADPTSAEAVTVNQAAASRRGGGSGEHPLLSR